MLIFIDMFLQFDDLSLSKGPSNPSVDSKIDAVEDKVTLLKKGCYFC